MLCYEAVVHLDISTSLKGVVVEEAGRDGQDVRVGAVIPHQLCH